jgi:hypothetical protein
MPRREQGGDGTKNNDWEKNDDAHRLAVSNEVHERPPEQEACSPESVSIEWPYKIAVNRQLHRVKRTGVEFYKANPCNRRQKKRGRKQNAFRNDNIPALAVRFTNANTSTESAAPAAIAANAP